MKITMTAIIEREHARLYTKSKKNAQRFYIQKAKKINPVYVRNTESSLEK